MYRSRLQQVEEKKNIRKAIWLSLGAIALLLALVVWGLPLLVKLAVVVGDLNANKQVDTSNDKIPPAPARLVLTTVATNSASFKLNGWAEPKAKVFVTQNLETIGSIEAADDGGFEIATKLREGRNEFVAVAIDAAGNKSQPSATAVIDYISTLPKLNLEAPADGAAFSGKDQIVEFKGTTDIGVRLTINDRIVVVNTEGKFSTKIQLNQGDNNFTIVATNKAGGQTKKELTLKYQP